MEEPIMSIAVADEILGSAMKLPDTVRARIAEALISSLDTPADQNVDRAWQIEINKRLHEIDSGAVKCIPWEEIRDRLYRNANVCR